METEKRVQDLSERLRYIKDIFNGRDNENVRLLDSKLAEFLGRERSTPVHEQIKLLVQLEDLFGFIEKKLDRELTPMDRVRIVRHPMRVCLKDILENVYDNYTEIGGQDEFSIDPSMIIARAYITRRVGSKIHNQPVMVIGQEKGHGQEFRNGGSVKPWGNAKALHYMKVAEIENIPIHSYVFTPGAYPIEDYPGAAQQIAKNLYEMAGIKVPIVAVFSEGGSGGAEAIALSDERLMLSHGYYSVISPEGAAAIESGIRQGQRAPVELVEKCASSLKITAEDNLRMGFVDRVIQEPPLGARPGHYDFFKVLRQEVIQATDRMVLSVKGINLYRAMALQSRRSRQPADAESIYVNWTISSRAKERLLWRRYQKFRGLAQTAYKDNASAYMRLSEGLRDTAWSIHSFFRYDFIGKHRKNIMNTVGELEAEVLAVTGKISAPLRRMTGKLQLSNGSACNEELLTRLSATHSDLDERDSECYRSHQAREDKAVTCPRHVTRGCLDIWAPDLFGDYAGVCPYCGHHFPMEYAWYLENVFDKDSVVRFGDEIEAGNPLDYEGFDEKLGQAKKKTRLPSSCVTFDARVDGVRLVVAMLVAPFRGGTVGAAEGEKFIRAAERARKRHHPFLAYVHGTAGIRIQEGVNGVIQMPRCTLAVRRYIEEGGLYLVVYDTNSYAGPVASFLGCSPYQFSIRSANIGFAGPGVIRETTGTDIPPDYHDAFKALSRGHIQGIWDRREFRKNLRQALMTMGGRNIYYR